MEVSLIIKEILTELKELDFYFYVSELPIPEEVFDWAEQNQLDIHYAKMDQWYYQFIKVH